MVSKLSTPKPELAKRVLLAVGIVGVVVSSAFIQSVYLLVASLALIAMPVFVSASKIDLDNKANSEPEYVDVDGGPRAEKEEEEVADQAAASSPVSNSEAGPRVPDNFGESVKFSARGE